MSPAEDVHVPDADREPTPEALPTHAEDGTDLTLIRWMLSLDPAERFEVLQSGARSLALLLDARPQR